MYGRTAKRNICQEKSRRRLSRVLTQMNNLPLRRRPVNTGFRLDVLKRLLSLHFGEKVNLAHLILLTSALMECLPPCITLTKRETALDVSDLAHFKCRIPNCLSETCNKLRFAVHGCTALWHLWPEDVLGPVNLSTHYGSPLRCLLSMCKVWVKLKEY